MDGTRFGFLAVEYRKLSGKRRLFVDAYIGKANCCKAEAARLAGYRHPAQDGYRVFKNAQVRAAIEERMREFAIGPEEILQRLSEQARANMADFVRVLPTGIALIDLEEAERTGKLRLVKKLGYDHKGRPTIELHCSQAALLALAKRYALFPDRQELTGADGGPVRVGITYEEALKALLSQQPGDDGEPAGEDEAAGAVPGAVGL